MSREIVNSVLLLWGSLFCAVSSLYFWITKYYRTVKRDWIYRMQVSTSVLLFWDAMTNLFRGRPDLLGFWMVRISNFLNFFLVELTLLFFHYYICAMLLTPEENVALKRVKVVRALCCVGLALVDLAIGVAMVLMFLVSIKEQNEAMLRLETSRAQIAEKLEIATVLNRCVEKLSTGGRDLDKATNELLGVISDYFAADRSYIFELDRERNVIVNTHEAVRDGVSEEKDNLQEVPLEAVAEWIEAFEREGVYFLPDLEQEKGKLIYDVLAPQNIHSLLAVPLLRDHVVTGFLGVDNPTEHVEDATLLSSIQFFVTNSLEHKKTQERLYKLCYIDMLTGLFNRNRYMEDLSGWEKGTLREIGGIYMDLNGLKHCNDRFGHEAGDALIRRIADALNEVFPGEGYRIGGDEFVVLRCPIGQEDFADKVHQLREALVRHGVDAAIGSFWQPLVEDLPAFLREADDRMYREKERQKRSARPSV